MDSRARMWVGASVVVLGVLLLLRSADVFPFNTALTTVLFLGSGGWLLYRRMAARRRGQLWLPLVLLGIGVLFLLRDAGVISERLGIWPVLIIALGAALVIGSLRARND